MPTSLVRMVSSAQVHAALENMPGHDKRLKHG